MLLFGDFGCEVLIMIIGVVFVLSLRCNTRCSARLGNGCYGYGEHDGDSGCGFHDSDERCESMRTTKKPGRLHKHKECDRAIPVTIPQHHEAHEHRREDRIKLTRVTIKSGDKVLALDVNPICQRRSRVHRISFWFSYEGYALRCIPMYRIVARRSAAHDIVS